MLRALQKNPAFSGVPLNVWHTPDHTQYAPDGSIDANATRAVIRQRFFADIQDTDVIFLSAHGRWEQWDAILANNLGARSDPFGTANPFVYALSCSTARYSSGYSFAEAFLGKGAAGYLGAVFDGGCDHNGICYNADRFFRFWEASVTVGQALKRAKRGLGGTILDRIWNGVYYLFGDPKFGDVAAPKPLSLARSGDPAYELPPADIPDWWPDRDFDWQVVDEGAGSTLVLTLYPFYYNHLTTEIAFFRNYTFRVETLVSPAEITRLDTDRAEYDPGEAVGLAFALRNTDAPMDAVIEVVVEDEAGVSPPTGLYLETLTDFQGTAGWSGTWDTTGADPGYYVVRATLRTPQGALLDRQEETFRIGRPGASVSGLAASATTFTPGDPVDLSVRVTNTGSVPLEGAVVFRVSDRVGAVVAEYRQELSPLAPGDSAPVAGTWDTAGVPEGTYEVAAFAQYDAQTTEPLVVEVGAATRQPGDLDGDGDVDRDDVGILLLDRRKTVEESACGPPCDLDGDGRITVLDARKLVLLCTRPRCAVE